jgi:hypothetical protein
VLDSGGDKPRDLVSGYFNGDEHVDIAVVNGGSGTSGNVAVFLGNGDATFQSPSVYPVGNYAVAIGVGEIVGHDEVLDLVVANRDDDTFQLLAGQGDGTFVVESPVTTSPEPLSVAVGDVSLDGTPDVIVGAGMRASNDAEIQIFGGEPGGGFALLQGISVPDNPTSVVVAKLNDDEKPDIAVASWVYGVGGDAVTVLRNNTVPTDVADTEQSWSQNRLVVLPNPVAACGLVRFVIHEGGNVRVWAADVAGRTVTELVSNALEPGTHELFWDGRSAGRLSSGVYYLNLEIDGVVKLTKKVHVVR